MQQVNLYLDEFRKAEPEMSASIIIILNGYVIGIGIIFTFTLMVINHFQFNEQVHLKQQSLYWQGQLQKTRKEYPEPIVSQNLINEIEDLEENEDKNRSVLNYLKNKDVEKNFGNFSSYLKGLTQVISNDLWLTSLSIKNGGKSFVIQGSAFHSDAVPEYIKKLSNIEALNRVQFEKIEFERKGKYIQFIIDSDYEEETIEGLLESAASKN